MNPEVAGRTFVAGFGHGLVGSEPDRIEQRPDLYRKYVQDLFAVFKAQAPKGAPQLSDKQLDALATKVAAIKTEQGQIALLRDFGIQHAGFLYQSYAPETHAKEYWNTFQGDPAHPELKSQARLPVIEKLYSTWAVQAPNQTTTPFAGPPPVR